MRNWRALWRRLRLAHAAVPYPMQQLMELFLSSEGVPVHLPQPIAAAQGVPLQTLSCMNSLNSSCFQLAHGGSCE